MRRVVWVVDAAATAVPSLHAFVSCAWLCASLRLYLLTPSRCACAEPHQGRQRRIRSCICKRLKRTSHPSLSHAPCTLSACAPARCCACGRLVLGLIFKKTWFDPAGTPGVQAAAMPHEHPHDRKSGELRKPHGKDACRQLPLMNPPTRPDTRAVDVSPPCFAHPPSAPRPHLHLPVYVCPSSQELNHSGNEIEKIEGLERLHQLRKLTLTTNKITSLAGLSKCDSLEHVLIQV